MKHLIASFCAVLATGALAAAPAPDEFAWRAPLQLPERAGLLRVELPASALLRMQSPDARDLRIFNAAGEAVPYAWTASPSAQRPPEEKTPAFPALPLYAASTGAPRPKGAVQVRIGEGAGQQVWVQLDGGAAADAPRLNAALFATREQRKPWSAIDVQATLPANTPVRVDVSTSADLATWTHVPASGRLFRFDGDAAPANLRLSFAAPLALEGRYLRLDWGQQAGVTVTGISGVLAPATAPPRRVEAELAGWRESSPDAIDLETGFATPIAALSIATARDNTLLPLRVLGRDDAALPWRVLGQGVVWRLAQDGATSASPAIELHGASARQLRVASTGGAALAPAQLKVTALFDARQLVFVPTGSGPFTLAVGRARTDFAALPLSTVTGVLGERKVEELPLATVGTPTQSASGGGIAWLPGSPNRVLVLWAVLGLGVLVLGGVAFTLLRQMKAPPR